MSAVLASIRTGAWLTRERVVMIACAVLIASACGLGFILATADGLSDYQGRPVGTDFSNVYAAGTYVLDGEPAKPFDPITQHEREQKIFGPDTPFYGWHYPPFFLFIAAALAALPYLPALAVWQAATFALYLLAIRAIAGSQIAGARTTTGIWLLLAAAFPAVFINLGHGHNGFLTAALLGGGLVLLDRKPIAAGILFGLLAYKPQFGVLLPVVLIATGRWRTVFVAAGTVATLALLATIAFGLPVWEAFLASTKFTRIVVLEAGDTGWHKIQSVFSWVRMWGGSVALAYAVQGAVTIALAAALIWLWRSRADFALKAAALVIASLLATPYSLDYDMMALAVAIAFLAAHGWQHGYADYEKTALACLWFVPLIARAAAQYTLLPLGVIVMLGVFALIIRRSAADTQLRAGGFFPTTA